MTLGHATPVALQFVAEPTPMQRGLLASQRLQPTSALQNTVHLTRFDGPIDADRLADAFERVVAGHDVLRSRFVEAGTSTRVRIADEPVRSTIIDLPPDRLHEWAMARAATPIDVARAAYDSVIIRHGDGTSAWYLALHHAVTDATSSLIVYELTATEYAEPGTALGGGGDYYAWWRSTASDQRTERAATHWRERLPAPRTGRLYRHVARADPASVRLPVDLDPELRATVERRLGDDLRSISDHLGWTVLLMTASATFVHRLTGADRMALGLPVHNRSAATTRRLIGPLMEVFPVDVSIEPGDTYRALHQRMAAAVVDTLRYARPGAAPPAPDCEAIVNVVTHLGYGPFAGTPATTEWIHAGASDPGHLFRLQLSQYGDDLDLMLDLNAGVADADHRVRAPHHLHDVLAAFMSDPDRSIDAAPLCRPDEIEQLRRWGRGVDPGPPPPSVVEQLEAALSGNEAVVIEDGDVLLTGDQLWDRVRDVAGRLRAGGVGATDDTTRVGIAIDRSLDAVVAIFATLVAGGSYVPLDPAQPAERRARLAERAGSRLVLDALPPVVSPPVAPDPASPAAADEAYLLFTSGSTGEPKGVPITHGGLARYLQFALDSYVEPGVAPVAPLFSALTFDLTVTSLFVPLLAGGRLVVIEPDGPSGLAELARRPDLTWCKATPSHLELLLRLDPACALRTLVVGGEAFSGRLAHQLGVVFPGCRIFNEYGPTEAVVGCMIHQHTAAGSGGAADVPIGRPAPDVELRIVDAALHDVPIGATGELLISHAGLTPGYLAGGADDDSEAADPFVQLDGARWYRSGDLVRLTDPDTAVYHGRLDEQIKTGGIRLEPSEVEQALTAHPAVARAAVRLWSPTAKSAADHCVRCGLPSNVPGVEFDADGVCATCYAYDRVRHQAAAYFRTPGDLRAIRDRARRDRTGRFDCLHLLSGGKDSTYALYQLVEMGFDVRAMTLDNGFISEGAKENVRHSIAGLGIEHEFVTTEFMDEIFRDSLERHSNVCNGCYKALYTLATMRADELGIPVIVTGLSRGQLFETRLVPQQFGADRFDADAIDRAVVEARRSYHRVDDAANRLLDTSVFDNAEVFDRISYVDFYRYVDVELADMYSYLDRSAPWVRPSDTGRSTNCLINAAGIHTHVTEQGYHNYAVPYAWDVRLGHKTRQEAIDELDDDLDLADVGRMLEQVGYEPTRREVLTAWYELAEDTADPQPAELRTFLAGQLPAHAIPTAFVAVDELVMTTNGKLDAGVLPEPARVHRSGPALEVPAETPMESIVVELYERVLGIEPIGVTDDFFDLGGDSLAALGLVVELSEQLGRTVRESLVFVNTTPRALAEAVASLGEPEPTDGDGLGAIDRRPAGAPPPPSALEQAMLFEHLDDPDNPRFNVGHLFRVRGTVDADRLVESVRTVVARHGPLTWTYGEPRRPLTRERAVDVVVRDRPIAESDLADSVRPDHLRPFDLEAGPVLRCVVQPLDDGSTAVLLVVHHVAVDAGSFDRLWAQIDLAYRGSPIDESDIDYAEHAAWQECRIDDADLAPWIEAPDPAALRFASGGDRSGGGYIQRTASFTTEELRAGPAATAFATALTALSVVLRSHAEGDRVGLGLTVSTREHPATGDLVGLFLNTIPVAIDVEPSATFDMVARAANTAVAEALAVRSVPLARIVAARRRAGLGPPAVDVLLAFEEWAPCRLGTAKVEHEVLPNGSPVADVTFFVQVHGSRIELSIEHRHAALDAAAADRLLNEFDRTIRRAIDRPRASVLAADRRTAPAPSLAVVAGPELSVDASALHEIIAEQARRDPAHPALRIDDEVVTYGDLDRRANRLAHELRSCGVDRGTVVGVISPRRPETVVSIVGVLKAGAAYVPIDPDYPLDRVKQIVDDAGLTTIVTPEASMAPRTTVPLVVLDGLDLDNRPDEAPAVATEPDDLAYLIYTSGSTGRPKGVMVRHRNIVASTLARDEVYPDPVERFLLLSSFAFDSSMVGVFWTLCTGGTLVLPPVDRHDDVLVLDEVIATRRITHLLALPSVYRLLVTEATGSQLRSLDTVIVAGEPCPFDVVALHRGRCPGALLANEYGPTEGTVWSHVLLVDDTVGGEPVPIGQPIPGTAHVVIDADGRAIPPSEPAVVGELYLAGAGVAAGYLHGDELTAERFVELPALGDALLGPWYRTGDLVRADEQGRLVYIGRADDQVKIRGVRVEPGEVEAAIRSMPGITDVVVGVVAAAGRDHLTAWVVADGERADTDGLRDHLAGRLPSQLVPSRYVALDALPLGPNGKLDRAALPSPNDAWVADTTAPGENATGASLDDWRVASLSAIWADALGVDRVGPDDNFFDLGGDSIISLQIVARARRAGIELRPRQVFDHQTVRLLAAVTADADGPRPDQTPVVGDVPLSPIQRWFVDQGDPVPDHWNQTIELELDPATDTAALIASLEVVRGHHDQLRARFDLDADPPTQTIDATGDAEPVLVRSVELAARGDDVGTAVTELEASLDLCQGRIVGVLVASVDGTPFRLVVTMHHLVVDSVSWSPILEDWSTAYAATVEGRAPALPARSTSFREWSQALSTAAATDRFRPDRSFWLGGRVAADSELELRRSPDNVEGATESVTVSLDAARTEALIATTAGYGDDNRTVEDVLLAALAVVVPPRLGQDHLAVTLEGHGREELVAPLADLSRTVGWFTTRYPVELRVGDRGDPAGSLDEIREQLRRIPDRGIGFGVDRHLRADDALASLEAPIVAFNYLGQLDRTIRATPPFTRVGALRGAIAAANRREHLLGIVASIRDDRLEVMVEYLPAHIERTAAEHLAAELLDAVSALTASADDAGGSAAFDLLEQTDADAAHLSALLDQLD